MAAGKLKGNCSLGIIVKRIRDNLGLEDGTMRLLGIWDTTLENGAAIAPHLHESVEEVYYVIEGAGRITIGDGREKGDGWRCDIYSSKEDPYADSLWREAALTYVA